MTDVERIWITSGEFGGDKILYSALEAKAWRKGGYAVQGPFVLESSAKTPGAMDLVRDMGSAYRADWELVRVSRELIDELLGEEPQRVVLVGLERFDDGTVALVFRTPDDLGPVAEAVAIMRDARGHYGIEETGGPGQPATEWDEIADRMQAFVHRYGGQEP
jgi:hypothetical protein